MGISKEDLESQFEQMAANPFLGISSDTRDLHMMKAAGLLGKAVIQLSKTNAELASANIKLTKTYTWLTVAMLVVATIQIALILQSH